MIAFCGKKGVGKDVCSDYLVKKYNYKKYAFATPLKEAVKCLFLFNDEQLYGDEKETIDKRWDVSPRQMFQFIGTDLIRNHLRDDYFIRYFDLAVQNKDKIVISDLRFVNESLYIKNNGGIIILITGKDNNHDEHVSEREYLDIKYDYIIHNTSTLTHLYQQLDAIMVKL